MQIFFSFTLPINTWFALAHTFSLALSSFVTLFCLSYLTTYSLWHIKMYFVDLCHIHPYLIYIFVMRNHTLPQLSCNSLLFAFIFPIFIPRLSHISLSFSYSTLSYCFSFIIPCHILLNFIMPVHTSSSTLSYLSLGLPVLPVIYVKKYVSLF